MQITSFVSSTKQMQFKLQAAEQGKWCDTRIFSRSDATHMHKVKREVVQLTELTVNCVLNLFCQEMYLFNPKPPFILTLILPRRNFLADSPEG